MSEPAAAPGRAREPDGAPHTDEDGEALAPEIEEAVEDAIENLGRNKRRDNASVEIAVQRAVRTVFSRSWGKRPAVSVLINRV